MQLKTLLNRVEKHKGFIYHDVRLVEWMGQSKLVVSIRPRLRSRPACSGCEARGPTYDTLSEREFQFVPLWGVAVVFFYAMRRVSCDKCGVKVESVPWVDGKSPLTKTYAWFLAGWAKRLSWKEVAESFRVSWDTVFRAVELAVAWGLQNRDLKGIRAIGVDEVKWRGGPKFLTVVYQIDAHRRRLLWIGEARTKATLVEFFRWFGLRTRWLQYVCSDMWRPYLEVIAERAPKAVHILDRYHIVANLNKSVDSVRAGEARRMQRDGYEPILKNSRWALLKRPKNLTKKQRGKLRGLLQFNLKTVRAYLLKEDFQLLWKYVSPTWAGKFLDEWCTTAMRSKIEEMKSQARTIRRHRQLILNWFEAKGALSSASVEGMNNKLKVITRRAYGFRTFKGVSTALYHTLGGLPDPPVTHRFF